MNVHPVTYKHTHACIHMSLCWSEAMHCVFQVCLQRKAELMSVTLRLCSSLFSLLSVLSEGEFRSLSSHFLVLPHPSSSSLCFLFLFFLSLVFHMLQTRISWLNIKHQLCGGYCDDKWSKGVQNNSSCGHYRKERKLRQTIEGMRPWYKIPIEQIPTQYWDWSH